MSQTPSCSNPSWVGSASVRYSFIGLAARRALRSFIRNDGSVTEMLEDGQVKETLKGDPLTVIGHYFGQFKVALRPGLPRFAGGWPATSATTPCAS